MDLTTAIKFALDKKSLLFLGSGYSIGATAINNKNLLTAKELAKELCKLANIPETLNLMDAADDYMDEIQDIDKVIETLSENLKAKEVEPFHREIAKVPWRCVFTTNYDNVYELSCLNEGKNYKTATLSDNIKSIGTRENLVVHLNGMVEKLNRDTLNNEFKLTDTSYLTNEFIDSLWYEKFIREAEISSSIFFIGYSLYDLDIKRTLNAHPALKEKTYFILPNFSEERTKRIANKYGTLIEKTTEEFSQIITEVQKDYIPTTHGTLLTSFETIDESSYSTTPSKIGYDDVFKMFFLGNYDKNKIYQSLSEKNEGKYYIKRKELISIFSIIQEESYKNILIQSDFGNGKTLLLEGVKALCAKNGIPCYQLIDETEDSPAELDFILKKTHKQVLIIENYTRYQKSIRQIAISRPDNFILILSERTAINDIFIEKLSNNLAIENESNELLILDVNILDEQSIIDLVNIFNDYGLWQEFSKASFTSKIQKISSHCKGSMASTLLEAIQSTDIEDRLAKIYGELKNNSAYRDIITTICIFSSMSYNTNLQTVLTILNNPIRNTITFKTNPAVRELFDTRTYEISLKSSILAKHIIYTFLNSQHVVSILIKIYKYCDERNHGYNNKYFILMRELDKFSTIQDLLPREKRLQSSTIYFDNIRDLNNNSSNYHYWLQYAISKTVYEDFKKAAVMFRSAYSLYNDLNRQERNNMLDNHYARFILLRAIKSNTHSSYENFKEANKIVQRQIHMVHETLHFPYRCTILYADYFRQEYSNFGKEEIDHFKIQINHILQQIDNIPANLLRNINVSKTKQSLNKILELLKEK